MYRVEPPDILTIDVMQQVAQSSYQLQVGDTVTLTVTGTFPDDNLLWKLPCANLNQICRDDPLHQTVLGVMVHIFSAMMTAYTR